MAILKKGKIRIIDPVCGMTIAKKNSALTSSYSREDYFFCSERCKAVFDVDPDVVLAMKAAREVVVEEERTESLDKMADELAHEIRNPLASKGTILVKSEPGKGTVLTIGLPLKDL